jgi:trans-2,3-dihydro-3-hydroxyanthranilate isomerase
VGKRRYVVYDVFTDTALAGNPLAVVLDAEGLTDEAMLRIAREFNLSETTFVLAPENPVHSANVRIFTPGEELPFAGHPTVGTAVALAENTAPLKRGERSSIVVLQEKIGSVRCAVTAGNGPAFAEFDLPRLPEPLQLQASREEIGAALGISHHDIGFENHVTSAWTAGVPYVCVPVANLEAAAGIRFDAGLWQSLAPGEDAALGNPFIYCRETVNHDCAFHARMFAPSAGIPEDPATGSAVAAFAGAILRYDEPVDGSHGFWVEQGIEMRRPSRIRLEIDVGGGKIDAARIGGYAVRVAEGTLFV